ncbi:tRNA lysidine(34) synthetase TilS [Chryseolinea sp. T2]|uniref:tRNA lysidine(34) synthetase TilS n=1 Tax=Chryseolinea sp. T2 TaxID=3129255 RepID=UPI003077A5D0
MLDQFLQFVSRNQLCSQSDSTLLTVSGGIDSIVMLYLFREAGFNISVAHANFQLRGDESDGDQQFVTEVCKAFNIPFFTRRFNTEEYAWENSLSIQLAAREMRYAWFKELADAKKFDHIATAHHFDDTMETILLNLIRGSGVDGFSGVPIKNGRIIRPLMFASRKQVEKYADVHGIVWREDESNHSDNYQRNYIRHHVMPHLREMNPSLESTWRNGYDKVNQEISIILRASEKWKTEYVREFQGRTLVSKTALDEYPGNPAMLWRFIRNFGFNFDQACDILRAVHGQPGKRFTSPTHLLVLDRTDIIIIEKKNEWNEVIVNGATGAYYMGPWSLAFHSVSETEPSDSHLNNSQDTAILDASNVSLPLTWRKWKAGDFFFPLGLGHRKKLSDFLVDEKLSVADKELVTVVESNGNIVWVSGLRIDDRFKITTATTKRIRLEISRL